MEGIIHLTTQALVAFAIYAAVVLAYTGLGAWKNINIWKRSWSWKTWLNGVAQYAVLGVAVLTVLISAYSIVIVAPDWGVQLDNAEQVSTRVIFGILAAGIIGMLLKCVGKIAEITGTSKEVVEKLQQSAIDNPTGPLILDVSDLPESTSSADKEATLEKTLVEQAVADYLGGRGAVVPTDNWSVFRNAVIGKGYDVDGYYNDQCWDGAALFWLNAVGRSFSTGGTGAARGGWEAARAANAGSEFDLITDRNAIQPGDWLVFGGTKWGHVGMAVSGNLGGYVRLLGQNQTGTGNGAPFNEINMNLGNFLGAFRLKRWHASPAPTPAPQPTPAPARKSNEEIALEVRRGDWGNGDERRNRLAAAGYDYATIQAIVNGSVPAPAPAPAAPEGFDVGQQVVPTALVDYNGTPLTQYDDVYTISEITGDRAVLTARGQVWAAMNVANLRHQ
jgi:hypothetical protein